MKIYKNGEYIEVEDIVSETGNESVQTEPEAREQPSVSIETALRDTMTAIASADTNSIAKIRAAAQQFLNATEHITKGE